MVHRVAINRGIYKLKNSKAGLGALIFGVAVVAAVAVGQGVGFAAVGGPTCNVPADYPTIQAAVAVAGCSTIKVAAGARTESVLVDRSVTIKGAKAGDNVNSRTFGSASESTITGQTDAVFTVQAPNVTIDGFSITNPGRGNGIVVKTAATGTFLKNNIVDTIGSAAFTANATGIYLENGPDSVKVIGNKINNIQSVPTAQGILVGDSTATNPSLDILLKNNTITNVTSTKGAYGIQVNNGASSTGYTEARIINNTVKDLKGGWVHGVGLEGPTPNVVVTYNSFSGFTNLVPAALNDAIGVNFEDNQFFFTAEVNRNSFALDANEVGIGVNPDLTNHYPSLTVDGECNWWNAANGPSAVGSGSGTHVSAGVDYKPWLKSNNLDKGCGDKSHGHSDEDHHYGRDNDWWDKRDD